MKKILSILFFLLVLVCYSQQEAANWYFGDNAGIQFDIDTNTVTPINDGLLSTDEGCTSISDTDGNLLFYTDGRTVWNRLHQPMSNANETPFSNKLNGDPSSTQSAIIIPKPNDPDIYYIFTVDTPSLDNVDLGFQFSEVDMTLNGGLGDVTGLKNQQLLSNTSEKLSAVLKDCSTQAIWVITFGSNSGGENNNRFFAYEVTNMGVNTTPVVSNLNFSINETRGYLKFSSNGEKLACANINQGLFLFDFDKNTGIVSNPTPIPINFNSNTGNSQAPYGIEFSPNNDILYVSTYFNTPLSDLNNPNAQYGALLQYNLNSSNISNSEIVIDERQTYRGGLQLGPDGRIYRAMSNTYNNGSPFLSVIKNPNQLGLACDYEHNTISLGANSRQGLPPFIASFFSENIDIIQNGLSSINLALCTDDIYTLMAEDIPGAIYTWTKDGSSLAETDSDLEITEPGTYMVVIDQNDGNCGILEGIANVSYFDIPIANQANDISVCDDNNDGISIFNFSNQDSDIIGSQNVSQFTVKYYTSLANANSNINVISSDFQNTSNPQTIYARIENTGNRNCFDLSTFDVFVYNTPTFSVTNPFSICENDSNPMDGFTSINLLGFNDDILDTQSASQFSVSYHTLQQDAESGNNPIINPTSYNNQNAFSETVFVRIENNDNADCFTSGAIEIIINPIPDAFEYSLLQCDEDGVGDGFTLFNLTEANDFLTGGIADRSVSFFSSQINAETNSNEIEGNSYANTANPEIIYVKIENTITNCVNYTQLHLEVSVTQANNYIATPVCDELNSEDGINTFNLDDFTNDILQGLPNNLEIGYYETYNDALLETETSELNSTYENTIPYSQTLFARIENQNACYGIITVLLTINPLPQLEEDETILYCLNEFPDLVILNAGILNDNPSNYSYEWSTNETTASISTNQAGTYSVIITNITTNCKKTKTIIIEPSNIATIENIEIIDGSLGNNQITVLTSGEGEYEYALLNQEGEQTQYQTSNTFIQVSPGIYSILVKDIKNNCGIIDDNISVIGFPLYFTPNGDTINDYWQVYGVSSSFQRNAIIYIFDRYGRLIEQVSAISKGWDGTFKGNPLPSNDYWFFIKLEDGREYRNHFTLKR